MIVISTPTKLQGQEGNVSTSLCSNVAAQDDNDVVNLLQAK